MRRLLRLALCLAVLAAAGHAAVRAAGTLAVSSDGGAAWLLRADGSIERIDLATRQASVLHAPAGAVALAVTGDARTLYAIAPSTEAKGTILFALSPDTGEERSHRNLKGVGRMLAVTTDGSYVCVVGQKGGSRALGGDDWTLTIVDAATGKLGGPLPLGVEPLAIALRDEAGAGRAGARLLVATQDRIATYLLDPPASSWFYRSPGENHGIDALDRSPLVCVLRGSEIALIDPRRQPRENGRIQLTGDDATSTITLGGPGGTVVLTPDGSTVAELRADGAGISLYDTLDGTLIGVRPLEDAPDLLARRVPAGEDRVARIVVASSLTGRVEMVEYPLPPPRPEPVPAPPGPPPPEPQEEPEASPAAEEAPQAAAPVPAPDEPGIPWRGAAGATASTGPAASRRAGAAARARPDPAVLAGPAHGARNRQRGDVTRGSALRPRQHPQAAGSGRGGRRRHVQLPDASRRHLPGDGRGQVGGVPVRQSPVQNSRHHRGAGSRRQGDRGDRLRGPRQALREPVRTRGGPAGRVCVGPSAAEATARRRPAEAAAAG